MPGRNKTECRFDFKELSIKEILKLRNDDVGHDGWVGMRGHFLFAIREALSHHGLIDDYDMKTRIEVRNGKLAPYNVNL